jgi:hypothetical protein
LAWWFALGLAVSVASAMAQTVVSLPTEGRFRAGRYLPVRVQRESGRGAVTLAGHGMLPTTLATDGPPDVVVPWLAIADSASDPRWQEGEGSGHEIAKPLRALGDDEKLVAFAGISAGAAQPLFTGKTIVPMELDLARPLLDPPEAWQCLDGIVLSPAAFSRLDDAHLTALLAGGTAIAVRSATRPGAPWGWTHAGADWILRPSPIGPSTLVEPAAYGPTYDWERGWPAPFRRRVVLAAALFCILGSAVLLWRSRWTAIAFVILSCASAALFAAWYASQSPMLQLAAAVRVDQPRLTQFDLWTWHSPVRAAEGSVPAAGLTWPVFASAHQAEQTQLHLHCSPDGQPDRFLFHLDPGQSLAFLSRDLQLNSPPQTTGLGAAVPHALAPPRGPFADLASTLYSRPGDAIAGQYTARESVPVFVVRQASR